MKRNSNNKKKKKKEKKKKKKKKKKKSTRKTGGDRSSNRALRARVRELERRTNDDDKEVIVSTTIDSSTDKNKMYGFRLDSSKLNRALMPPGSTPDDVDEVFTSGPDILAAPGKTTSSNNIETQAYILAEAVTAAQGKKAAQTSGQLRQGF